MPEEENRLATTLHSVHRDARAIFAHALEACRIERAFHERIRLEGTTMVIEHAPDIQKRLPAIRIDLRRYRKVLIVALGKAAAWQPQRRTPASSPFRSWTFPGSKPTPSLPAQPWLTPPRWMTAASCSIGIDCWKSFRRRYGVSSVAPTCPKPPAIRAR